MSATVATLDEGLKKGKRKALFRFMSDSLRFAQRLFDARFKAIFVLIELAS